MAFSGKVLIGIECLLHCFSIAKGDSTLLAARMIDWLLDGISLPWTSKSSIERDAKDMLKCPYCDV